MYPGGRGRCAERGGLMILAPNAFCPGENATLQLGRRCSPFAEVQLHLPKSDCIPVFEWNFVEWAPAELSIDGGAVGRIAVGYHEGAALLADLGMLLGDAAIVDYHMTQFRGAAQDQTVAITGKHHVVDFQPYGPSAWSASDQLPFAAVWKRQRLRNGLDRKGLQLPVYLRRS